MQRKSIATNMAVVACDVCGRTLLRGENADVFLHQGSRRMVCELCISRAVHEGWLREGLGDMGGTRSAERGGAARSLLNRLRPRRPAPGEPGYPAPAPSLERLRRSAPEPDGDEDEAPVPVAEHGTWAGPEQAYGHPAPAEPEAPAAPRERRDIQAVPTNAELKVGRALEVFNDSAHPRTVAGVARTLGAPIVSARPSRTEGAIVTIVVAWELSWYRYEVDLGDEAAGVRVAIKGNELSELDPADQSPNAAADDRGELHLVAGVA